MGDETAIFVDIYKCARCGEGHKGLCFGGFHGVDIDGYTHWANCPATGDPVLLKLAVEPSCQVQVEQGEDE